MIHWPRITSKPLEWSPYATVACLIIICAVTIRVILISLNWPLLDSDEGTMGLMAMHIAYRGEWPIFFYGQGYMGASEAYIAALMFRLFGVSAFTLRLGLLFFYTGFLIAIYLLTSLLYDKKWALITLGFLALGSNPILTRELVAVGGDPETLLSGSLILLLSTWLALSGGAEPGAKRGHRLLAFAAWGFMVGFGLWSHLLVAPFVLMGGLMLLLFCWRDIRSFAPLCLLAGLLIGGLPLLIYNITAPPGRDSLSVLWSIHRVSGIPQPPFAVLFPYQISGAFLVSLPTATGANPLCSPSDVQWLNFSGGEAIRCTLVHSVWSLGCVFLWLVSTAMAVAGLRLPGRHSRPWTPEQRQSVIRSFARFSLLATAALTMVLYVLSPNPALFPVATSRYLIAFLIVTPALLWPLWHGFGMAKPLAVQFARFTVSLRFSWVCLISRGVLLLVGAVFLLGVFSTFTGIPGSQDRIDNTSHDVFATQAIDQHFDVPATRSFNRQEAELMQHLKRLGITHIYSDYWTCDRLIFQSHEHIVCAALSDKLRMGHDRYTPYHFTVFLDPHASYVLPLDSPLANVMARSVSKTRAVYQRFIFNGYIIYMPPRR